jgi:NO-binding membrane sensor protein with MHYT domain
MNGPCDLALVAPSFLIAVLVSYPALNLASRVFAAAHGRFILWLSGGAVAMGIGI